MVSSPRERGDTSNSNTSFTSPPKIPAWMAAPIATTSSGFTFSLGSRSIKLRTSCLIKGILVPPPTKTTSSICTGLRPASDKARFKGRRKRLIKSPHKSSNSGRVKRVSRCLGPSASVAVINGKLISVTVTPDNSILAFSAASVSRCKACRSSLKSIFSCSKNFSANQLTMRLSKSPPPNWVSPLVAFTSKTPSPTSNTDTSKVPPPKSNTRIFWLLRWSNP